MSRELIGGWLDVAAPVLTGERKKISPDSVLGLKHLRYQSLIAPLLFLVQQTNVDT